MTRTVVARVLVALLVACGLAAPSAGPASAQVPDVESHYEATGPWGLGVVTDTTTLAGFAIYRPTVFGARPTGGAFSHPVITWGNGTSLDFGCSDGTATPSISYLPLFKLYASWGFVVVASNDCWVGTGAEQKAGAEAAAFMDAAPPSPTNPYAGKLDEARIAAVGHSQGAIGSIYAAKATPLIKAVVTFALPTVPGYLAACLVKPAGQEPCLPDIQGNGLTAPTFFVTGSEDWFVSPQSASAWIYGQMPAGVPKARGDALQNINPAVTPENYPLDGVNRDVPDGHSYVPAVGRGYSLAWLFHRLYGDTFARSAFVGSTGVQPQICTNPDWRLRAIDTLTC